MSKVMRHVSREIAMKIAFARLLGGTVTYDDTVELSYAGQDEYNKIMSLRSEDDIQFANMLAEGVEEHRDELDERINDYLKEWSTDTISKIELTILRIAMFELIYTPDVPCGAVVDEAVELTKQYSDENKYSYVNGVLSAFIKDMANT